MRLSEVGELGLLAELERRGLAQRIEHDAVVETVRIALHHETMRDAKTIEQLQKLV